MLFSFISSLYWNILLHILIFVRDTCSASKVIIAHLEKKYEDLQAPERPFRFLNQEVPKQRDSSSCGWRVIANAWRFIESKYRMVSLTVSSAKLIKFKMFMCRVCDFNHIFFLVCSYMIIQNLGYGGSERSPFHLFLMGPSLQMT